MGKYFLEGLLTKKFLMKIN